MLTDVVSYIINISDLIFFVVDSSFHCYKHYHDYSHMQVFSHIPISFLRVDLRIDFLLALLDYTWFLCLYLLLTLFHNYIFNSEYRNAYLSHPLL